MNKFCGLLLMNSIILIFVGLTLISCDNQFPTKNQKIEYLNSINKIGIPFKPFYAMELIESNEVFSKYRMYDCRPNVSTFMYITVKHDTIVAIWSN